MDATLRSDILLIVSEQTQTTECLQYFAHVRQPRPKVAGSKILSNLRICLFFFSINNWLKD